MEDAKKIVEKLIEKADTANTANEACAYTQAALNAAADLIERYAAQPTSAQNDKDERAYLQIIDERDAAQEALSQAYYLVTGRSPDWSSVWGINECLEEIDDAQQLLRKAVPSPTAALALGEQVEYAAPSGDTHPYDPQLEQEMSTESGMVLVPRATLEEWATSVMSLAEYDDQHALADDIRYFASHATKPVSDDIVARAMCAYNNSGAKVFEIQAVSEHRMRAALEAALAVALASPPTPALELRQSIDSIIRDVCEAEPAEPNKPNTVCIDVDYLREILESALLPEQRALNQKEFWEG